MGFSSSKGSSFERSTAKQLSMWVSEDADKWIFSRRSGSGGAARDRMGYTNSGGDIFADKTSGKDLTDHITFELKFYRNLTPELWKFLSDKKSIFDKFIKQAKESADVYNREWALIFKCNFRETFLLTSMLNLSKVVHGGIIIKYPRSCFLVPFEKFLQSDSKEVLKFINGR